MTPRLFRFTVARAGQLLQLGLTPGARWTLEGPMLGAKPRLYSPNAFGPYTTTFVYLTPELYARLRAVWPLTKQKQPARNITASRLFRELATNEEMTK